MMLSGLLCKHLLLWSVVNLMQNIFPRSKRPLLRITKNLQVFVNLAKKGGVKRNFLCLHFCEWLQRNVLKSSTFSYIYERLLFEIRGQIYYWQIVHCFHNFINDTDIVYSNFFDSYVLTTQIPIFNLQSTVE